MQALFWEYYSRPKNLVVIQFIKYLNFEINIKNIRIWRFFQILTYDDNYKQTNGIQLEFFYRSPILGILQQTK